MRFVRAPAERGWSEPAAEITVFSRSADRSFAAEMCDLLGVELSSSLTQRFSSDCIQVQLQANCRRRDVIVLDDEIATAGSIVELLAKLRDYDVRSVSVCTTHGLFTGSDVERLAAQADVHEIVTTNTVPLDPATRARMPHLHVRSVAPLFAEAVRRNNCGESVSSLFDAPAPCAETPA